MAVITTEQLRALILDAIAKGKEVRGPTLDKLANEFAPQSLLNIARRRDFDVRLSEDGQRPELGDEIPLWFARAIWMHEADILELMHDRFLGNWGSRGGPHEN